MSSADGRVSDPDVEELLRSATFADQQHEVYRRLRETAPVYWSATSNQWLVTSFDLVEEILTSPERFSSVGAEMRHIGQLDEVTRSAVPRLCSHFAAQQMNISDPPGHTRIRRAFNRLFLQRRIEGLRPSVAKRADDLVATAVARTSAIEVMADLAEPLPVQVIAEIMGLTGEQRERIAAVTLAQRYFFGLPPGRTQAADLDAALREWHESLAWLMERRRQEPRDDVMSTAARLIDEGVLDEDEAIATCLHLIIAGNSTTTALIGNVVHLLLRHPAQLELVTSQRALIPGAVEEALRFEAPLPRDRRIATETTTVGGVTIRADERVACVLAAACRDPAHFSEPDVFDVARRFGPREQAAFGRGIHLCVGAPVARLEAAISVEAVVDHVPNPVLAPGFEPAWHEVQTHRSLVTLPVRSGAGLRRSGFRQGPT